MAGDVAGFAAAVRGAVSAGACVGAGGTLPQPISASGGNTVTATVRHRNWLSVCNGILVLPLA
jgi:hypothetical protein